MADLEREMREKSRERARVSDRERGRACEPFSSCRYTALSRDSGGHCFLGSLQYRSEEFRFRQGSEFRTVVIEDYVTRKKAFVRIIVAVNGRRNRFVYLEPPQEEWLGNSLREISRKGWDMKTNRQKKGSTRIIQIARLACRKGNFIKISERQINGYLSFILIPFAPSEWEGMIVRLCRPTTKVTMSNRIMRSAWVAQGKSFADAVKLGFPSEQGKSIIKSHKSQAFMVVEENGVNNRLQFLDQCLMISFFDSQNLGIPSSLTEDFVAWARERWGLSDGSVFSNRAGDLWYLICDSLSEAIRVQEDGHAKFREWNVLLRFWKEDDGR
ncbi:unnamed protein product [Linum trigynum]|uniref:Uncharacterized protein n=1 Tax=Linum trigynum TaxID=586398 RepID=A0AAV2DWT5_9ROSI